ncbi:calmodulin-beta-like isoform X2 [Ruditapes philippinarum]|uniref:calmodulin-beta-like isoform X2 n=1 Tax=Ruditapes philippinarum TaxID=129788 RepID=UPI00295C140F|nr:calmodulin-beta-like isoform X2 [Ruditapes philippinarum]
MAGDYDRTELQEAFVLFDKNQDGMITKEELGAVLHALGQRPTVSEVQALIHSVDLDKSGTIDFEEFVKIFSTKLSIDPEKELHEVFCIFDENGDGFISSDELYSMLHKLGEHITKHEAQKMINEADLNRDGKVDYREFKAILNAR